VEASFRVADSSFNSEIRSFSLISLNLAWRIDSISPPAGHGGIEANTARVCRLRTGDAMRYGVNGVKEGTPVGIP